MANIFSPNVYEVFLLIVAMLLLAFSYVKAGYKRNELLVWLLIMLPIFYFSINMLTEVVTVDEPQYEECITDIRNLKDHDAAIKMLYEYKLEQLTVGTIFWFFPRNIRQSIGENGIWMIYKCIHWLIMYGFSLIIVGVWRKYILNRKDDFKNRFAENAVLLSLIGLPLSCLIMKVANYDAGSIYPAILGISLLWAAFNTNNKKMGFLATVVTAMGVLDKWTALLYWIISVILFAHLVSKEKQTWKNKIVYTCLSVILSYGIAIVVSLIYFIYASFQQGGFCKNIDIGVIVFSFVYAIKGVLTGNLYVNSASEDCVYIPILILIMIVVTLLLQFIYEIISKRKKSLPDILFKIDGMMLILGIMAGMIGTYLIPLRIAPFLEIATGKYVSTDSFDGWIYHYGMRSAFGHFAAKISYECATIVANYPSALLVIIFFAAAVILLRHMYQEEYFICSLLLFISISVLILYSIMGLPTDAKYYAYPMFIIVLSSIYICYDQGEIFIISRKKIILLFYVIYTIEMLIFVPNVKSFSPIWVWHSPEHNNTIRKGKWYAGEIMFWGEQLAIAGNIIEEIKESESPDQVIIYSNYGTTWPGNPGYAIAGLDEDDVELRFDENAYYVMNKFWLFRTDVPPYLYEVEPVATISYKGEIGTWIYRGDQLKDYLGDFEK